MTKIFESYWIIFIVVSCCNTIYCIKAFTVTIQQQQSFGRQHNVFLSHNDNEQQQQQQQQNPFRPLSSCRKSVTQLYGYRDSLYTKGGSGRGSDNNNEAMMVRSKRQDRVGQLVAFELSRIIHSGNIKGRDVEFLDDELRKRISIVKTDISPDLRQARVSVSIRGVRNLLNTNTNINNNNMVDDIDNEEEEEEDETDDNNNDDNSLLSASDDEEEEDDDDDEDDEDDEGVVVSAVSSSSAAVDKRRAYSWLVRNTKNIRHTLAQKMSHMKSCPALSFVQVDVGAAVDVMYLIDKVVAGQKRSDIPYLDGNFDENDFMDDDEDDDDDDWEEIDNEFFQKKEK